MDNLPSFPQNMSGESGSGARCVSRPAASGALNPDSSKKPRVETNISQFATIKQTRRAMRVGVLTGNRHNMMQLARAQTQYMPMACRQAAQDVVYATLLACGEQFYELVFTKRRIQRAKNTRYVIAYLLRQMESEPPLKSIGGVIKRDHTSVIHAIDCVATCLKNPGWPDVNTQEILEIYKAARENLQIMAEAE